MHHAMKAYRKAGNEVPGHKIEVSGQLHSLMKSGHSALERKLMEPRANLNLVA